MVLKAALSASVLAVLLGMAAANHIPIKFCVLSCNNGTTQPKSGVAVQLGGCIDEPAICTTGTDGCCIVDTTKYDGRHTIQYCSGAAGNFCNWNILSDDSGPYVAEPQTFLRNGKKITPKEFSCCWCNGQDYCNPTIYADAGRKECTDLKAPDTSLSSSGIFNVTFTPKSCHCQQ